VSDFITDITFRETLPSLTIALPVDCYLICNMFFLIPHLPQFLSTYYLFAPACIYLYILYRQPIYLKCITDFTLHVFLLDIYHTYSILYICNCIHVQVCIFLQIYIRVIHYVHLTCCKLTHIHPSCNTIVCLHMSFSLHPVCTPLSIPLINSLSPDPLKLPTYSSSSLNGCTP